MFKKILFIFLFTLTLCGCSSNIEQPKDSNPSYSNRSIKVIYFSCTHHTENVAKKIAKELNCPIEEILPETLYSDEDLNYNVSSSRANQEQNDPQARPKIQNTLELDSVDTIFLGCPIWWGKLPKIIYTFLEEYSLDQYTIVPFCTSGSSPIQPTITEIKQLEPNAQVFNGKRFDANASEKEIQTFIQSLHL